MTFEQLKVLHTIIELGSLKAASLALHKTQPALSMAIKKLEAEYNVALLDRSEYRLKLTPQGEIFYRQAQEVLIKSEKLNSLGHQLAQGNEAVLKIAYDPMYPIALITATLAKCQQKFPTTEFQLFEGSRFSSLEQLNNKSVDIAISAWNILLYALGDYEMQPLTEFEIITAIAPKLLADGESIKQVQQLNNYPSISLLHTDLLFDNERLGGVIKTNRKFKTRDINTLKEMLVAGLGTAFIPRNIIRRELSDGRLVEIILQDHESSIRGDVRLIKRLEQTLGPAGQFFWDTLKEGTDHAVARG